MDACLGHRTFGDPDQQALKQGRKPTLTTKAKEANAETHRVIIDPESKEHIPELEYDCAGRMITPFTIPAGMRL